MKKTNALLLSISLLTGAHQAQAGFLDFLFSSPKTETSSFKGKQNYGGGGGYSNTNVPPKTPHTGGNGNTNSGHYHGDSCKHPTPPPKPPTPPPKPPTPPPKPPTPPPKPPTPPPKPPTPPPPPGDGGGDFPDDGGGFPPPDDGGTVTPSDTGKQQEPPKDSKKWRVNVIPVPYLDFDFGKKIIMDDEESPDAKSNFVSNSASEQRYRVVKYHTLDFGLGVAAVFHEVPVTVSSFMPTVGLLPIVGSQAVLDRHVFGRAAADNITYPSSYPPKPEEVLSWQTGDSVTYQARGGLAFFAGAGIAAGVGGAVSFYAEGLWTTRIEKAGDTAVVAKITKSKLGSFRANFGSVIAAVGLEDFKSTDDGFAFRFDLSEETAAKAYHDFVLGNFTLAQNEFLRKNKAVQPDHVIAAVNKGNSWNLWLGIPILANYVSSTGKVYTHSETVDVEDEQQGPRITRSKIDYGFYNFSEKTKFFFKHINTVGSFIGSHYSTVAEEGPVGAGEVGKFIWSYETDIASPSKVKGALEKLTEITGLDNFNVFVPQVDDLGYANVQFTMDIPENTSDYLINLGSNANLHSALMVHAKAVNDPFIARKCGSHPKNKDERGSYDPCPSMEKRRVEYETRLMAESLQDMYAAHQRQDWPSFARAYGEFGKSVLKSRNSYQTFLAMVSGQAALSQVLEVTGEKFSRQRKVISN